MDIVKSRERDFKKTECVIIKPIKISEKILSEKINS